MPETERLSLDRRVGVFPEIPQTSFRGADSNHEIPLPAISRFTENWSEPDSARPSRYASRDALHTNGESRCTKTEYFDWIGSSIILVSVPMVFDA